MKYLAIASVASLALLAACNQGGDSAAQNTGEAVNATPVSYTHLTLPTNREV